MTFPTLKRHSKRVMAPTGEGREEPVHDRELHAEGHFPRRLVVVKMLAGSYLPEQKSILSDQKGLPAIFFLLRRQILERTWKILPLSPGENTSEWCQRLVVPGFSQGFVRTILLFSERPHQAVRPSGGSPPGRYAHSSRLTFMMSKPTNPSQRGFPWREYPSTS
jgi:hypothetical protein